MASNERNALAELAHTLCGVVIDDECYATVGECVDAMNAIKKARLIIAELAKVESLYEKMNAKASDGNVVEAEELAHELHIAKGSILAKCRAIAEEGAKE